MGGTIDIDCDAEGRGRCSRGSGDGPHSSRGNDSRGQSGNSSRDYPSSSRESGDSRGVGSGSSSSRDVSSSYDEAVIKRNQAKISMSPHDYSQATVSGMDKHFVTSYDHGNGRLDINGFCHAGNQAVARVVEHLKYQAKQKEEASGTGHTILAHKHTLNFSFNLMCDEQVANLAECLKWQKLDLLTLNLSYNNITCKGVEPLFYQLSTGIHFQPHNIQSINLSNCNIGDTGAEYIAQSLISGRYPATKYINLSGNNITSAGETQIVQTLNSPATPDIVVITRELQDSIKMITGTREEKIAIFRDLLRQGAEKGTNDMAIVADGSLKNKVKLGWHNIAGFIKCKWNPEEIVQGYAQDKIFAKLPQTLGKFLGNTLNIQSIVSCYLEATNDAWTSDIGQAVLKDQLCVMGETEFCNDE